MPTLLDKFVKKNVTQHNICCLKDGDSSQLGVKTVGERIRIREAEKSANQVDTPFYLSVAVFYIFDFFFKRRLTCS